MLPMIKRLRVTSRLCRGRILIGTYMLAFACTTDQLFNRLFVREIAFQETATKVTDLFTNLEDNGSRHSTLEEASPDTQHTQTALLLRD